MGRSWPSARMRERRRRRFSTSSSSCKKTARSTTSSTGSCAATSQCAPTRSRAAKSSTGATAWHASRRRLLRDQDRLGPGPPTGRTGARRATRPAATAEPALLTIRSIKDSCSGNAMCTGTQPMAYYYTPATYVQQYWNMAIHDGVLSDHTFQENEAHLRSTNHLYVLASAAYTFRRPRTSRSTPTWRARTAGLLQRRDQSDDRYDGAVPHRPSGRRATASGPTPPSAVASTCPRSRTSSTSHLLTWGFIQQQPQPNGDGAAVGHGQQYLAAICMGVHITGACTSPEWVQNVGNYTLRGRPQAGLRERCRRESPCRT